MPNTPALGFPYPAPTDLVADGYQNIEQLAEAVEDALLGENYVGRYRNLLYNGDMRIAQRATSVPGVTGGGYLTVDRFTAFQTGAGTFTVAQVAEAPAGSGFASSWKWTVTSSASVLAPSAACIPSQVLEGQDLQHLLYGNAGAKELTLSFWVRSSWAGTYVCELQLGSRWVSQSYSIPPGAAWQKVELTFPGNTVDTIANNNAGSLTVRWWLVAGSNYTSGTLGTTWNNVNANRAVGQQNLATSVFSYWQITGCQLEVGDKATTFEHKTYGEELARCARYYLELTGTSNWGFATGVTASATSVRGTVPFPTPMRATPTIVGAPAVRGGGANLTPVSLVLSMTTGTHARWVATVSGAPSAEVMMLYGGPTYLDAEL